MSTPSQASLMTWPLPEPSPNRRYRSPRPAAVLRAELERLDRHHVENLARRGPIPSWHRDLLSQIDAYRHALQWVLGERDDAPITGRVMPGADPMYLLDETQAGRDVYENPNWTPPGTTWVAATSALYALDWATEPPSRSPAPADTVS